MAQTVFIRNRAFIRSIAGIGRDIHRAHVAHKRGNIPYLSRADEFANRKARNKLYRNAAREHGRNRFQQIQDAIATSRATAIKARSKVDKIARLGS